MIIRFGLDFDSLLPEPAETRLGFVVAGPALFLSILEAQLGIIPFEASAGKRIVQYRACLAKMDTPERFYSRSFSADEIVVDRALLHWRDTWYMAGWEGTFAEPVGKRLQDMADVEVEAKEIISPSFGERLATVLKTLERRSTQIKTIELIDDPADYPYLWRQVLAKFRTVPLAVGKSAPFGKEGSDLALLQKALVSTGSETNGALAKVNLAGDGSVMVLRSSFRAVSARVLAEYLKRGRNPQTAVLTGAHGYEFDEALDAVDLPKCGFQPLSMWRPPLQSLPLALGLHRQWGRVLNLENTLKNRLAATK